MGVTEAVRSRRSIRAFADLPIDSALVKTVFREAAQAPSGGNLQPWVARLVEGEAMRRLRARMRQRCAEHPQGEVPGHGLLPADVPREAWMRQRRRTDRLADTLGDPIAEKVFLYDNFQFFGAPVGVFVLTDRRFGARQWLDLGLYMQTAMLLLREAGLDSCYIGAWAMFEPSVLEILGLPDSLAVVCGVAIGVKDEAAAINSVETERADPFGPIEGER